MVHILDLYDIHARSNSLQQPMERAALIVRDFISMLYDGGPTARNGVAAYASRLCVTPHYLTEVCRSVSGRPASYWIERFAMREVVMLLARRDLTLTSIAERLGFSSLSYFTPRHHPVGVSLRALLAFWLPACAAMSQPRLAAACGWIALPLCLLVQSGSLRP